MRTTLVAAATALLVVAASAAPAAPAAAQTITIGPGATIPPGQSAQWTPDFGEPQGQTFVVPVGFPVLQEFRWLPLLGSTGNPPSPGALFKIYLWDGSAPVGPAVFSVALPYLLDAAEVPFTGALSLTEGQAYVATLAGTGGAYSAVGYDPSGANLYADGSLVFFDGSAWRTTGPRGEGPYDARFEATFGTSSVPEPGTWALLATGLVGVAGVARRRGARSGA